MLAGSPRISKRDVAQELMKLNMPAMSLAAAGGFNVNESAPQSSVMELEEACARQKSVLSRKLSRARAAIAAWRPGCWVTLYNKLEEHKLE